MPNSEIFVIGDTPLDIEAAHAVECTAIAVATGHHDADALREAVGGTVEAVDRLAAVEVADPLDPGVVVVAAVRVLAAHRPDGDVLEHGVRAEGGGTLYVIGMELV